MLCTHINARKKCTLVHKLLLHRGQGARERGDVHILPKDREWGESCATSMFACSYWLYSPLTAGSPHTKRYRAVKEGALSPENLSGLVGTIDRDGIFFSFRSFVERILLTLSSAQQLNFALLFPTLQLLNWTRMPSPLGVVVPRRNALCPVATTVVVVGFIHRNRLQTSWVKTTMAHAFFAFSALMACVYPSTPDARPGMEGVGRTIGIVFSTKVFRHYCAIFSETEIRKYRNGIWMRSVNQIVFKFRTYGLQLQ